MEDRPLLSQDRPLLSQLVLYDGDSVEASYSDGCKYYLSPCGMTFRYYPPPKLDDHQLKGIDKFQQRTEFVTSQHRDQVMEMVEFRNRFADQPYVCATLLNKPTMVLYADISEIAWPRSVHTSQLRWEVEGDVSLVSEDELAIFTLAVSRQHYTVTFLAKLSQQKGEGQWQYTWLAQHASVHSPHPAWHPVLEVVLLALQEEATVNSDREAAHACDVDELHGSNEDIPLSTRHSAGTSHKLHLVEKCRKDNGNANTTEKSDDELPTVRNDLLPLHSFELDDKQKLSHPQHDILRNNDTLHNYAFVDTPTPCLRRGLRKDLSTCMLTCVPAPLPRVCPFQHRHSWPVEGSAASSRLKVVCMQGIVYRLIWTPQRIVEIYPGDGSVLTSSSVSGEYFTHHVHSQGKLMQLMYTAKKPPPSAGHAAHYPLGPLLARGAGLMETMATESLALLSDQDVCWRLAEDVKECPEQRESKAHVLEVCSVADLGRFTAFTNGHIRAVFEDRTCLDLAADLSGRLPHLSGHLPGQATDLSGCLPGQASRFSSHRLLELPPHTARLLLPSGQYHVVTVTEPGQYARYIQPTLDWVAWVNTPPPHRSKFYVETVFDPHKQRAVLSELKKIECFNYIHDQQAASGGKWGLSPPSGDRVAGAGDCGTAGDGGEERGKFYSANLAIKSSVSGSETGLETLKLDDIRAVLDKTAAALRDIESFLNLQS